MRLIPFGILAAAAAWLAWRWDSLPERWVTHWSREGVPDGWMERSVLAAASPLLIGLFTCVVLEVSAVVTRRTTEERWDEIAAGWAAFIRWFSVGAAAGFAAVALLLPSASPPSPSLIGLCVLGAGALGMAVGITRVRAAERVYRARGGTFPEGHHLFYYANRDDPRLIVPKTVGVGATFNFARPMAWVLLLLIVLPSLVVVAVLFTVG